ncbi:MAG TPA: DUF4395 domain-containing protein [Actinocrinis sp.]|nr:DUF4395 domain-containing protein [Actinocrinis sp.]
MPTPASSSSYIDPRGPRFGAAITTVVLAIVLVTGGGWLLAAQAFVFALGGFLGLKYAPYGFIYRTLVRPRLGRPAELENPAPPQFAQIVGFAFAAVGAIGYLSGVTALGVTATALALAAAFLNAAFDFCLGCEVYLLFRRSTVRRQPIG